MVAGAGGFTSVADPKGPVAGFDPVMGNYYKIEYHKSVEMFDTHYKLKSDDIFHIIIQLSRFFKDFSVFETNSTPDFRHPPIKGGEVLN